MSESESRVSFEEALAELERIVHRLESGDLPLEDSLAQYELGITRLRACYALLERAEARIRQIEIDNQGNVTERAFDTGESAP